MKLGYLLISIFSLLLLTVYLKTIINHNREVVKNNSRICKDLPLLRESYISELKSVKNNFFFIECVSRKQFDKYDRINTLYRVCSENKEAVESIALNSTLQEQYYKNLMDYSKMGLTKKECEELNIRYQSAHNYESATFDKFNKELDKCTLEVRIRHVKKKETLTKYYTYRANEINECLAKLSSNESRKMEAEHQRSLMTPSIRYDVMKRDGFRCVLCGKAANDGVQLHVDHIIPVSKGGKTVMDNLRTLCSDCNLGKSNKYDANGDN